MKNYNTYQTARNDFFRLVIGGPVFRLAIRKGWLRLPGLMTRQERRIARHGLTTLMSRHEAIIIGYRKAIADVISRQRKLKGA